jgi:sortase A
VGDEIDLETPKRIGTYVVDEIHIVTPDDVDVLRPRGAPSLTLVTCYPFYFVGSAPQRYIVMASLAGGITQRTGNLDLPAAISNEQFKKEKQ